MQLHELRTLARGTGMGEARRILGDGFGGVFSTEVGTAGEIVMLRLYVPGQDAKQSSGRARLEGSMTGSHIVELLEPAPYMRELGPQEIGKVYELSWLDFPAGGADNAISALEAAVPARERHYPLVGVWSVEVGFALDRVYILTPFKDWAHRHQLNDALRAEGAWPPALPVKATAGGSKLLLPAGISQLK
jgi:hypothetical protein